jgi:hypothetical protein
MAAATAESTPPDSATTIVDGDGDDDDKARRGGGVGWVVLPVVWAATAAPRCPVAERITTTEIRDDRHISSAASTVVQEQLARACVYTSLPCSERDFTPTTGTAFLMGRKIRKVDLSLLHKSFLSC